MDGWALTDVVMPGALAMFLLLNYTITVLQILPFIFGTFVCASKQTLPENLLEVVDQQLNQLLILVS